MRTLLGQLKYLFFFILITTSILSIKSQNYNYMFLPRNENMKDYSSITKLDSMFIWCSQKTFISDSVFRFGPIICSSDTCDCCFIYFKIDSENNWYIVDSNQKYLFYDSKQNKLNDYVSVKCDKDYFSCGYSMLVENMMLLCFKIKKPGYISGDTITYWFNNEYGIVAVCSGISCFVRDDFIEKIDSKW